MTYVIEAPHLNPIVKIRYAKGLSVKEFAEMVGVSRGRIAQIENGINAKELPAKVLLAVARLGYDPIEVQKEYLEWKAKKDAERAQLVK